MARTSPRASLQVPRLLALLALTLALASGACKEPAPSGDRSAAFAAGGSLVSSVRGEPRTFNRLAGRDATSETIAFLIHSRLVRVNRVTGDVEPWLAERWETSPDGLSTRLSLRRGVRFSDGEPFSSADVLFSFRAVYDEKTGSSLGESLRVGGKPLEVSAPDENTVVVRFPAAFGPGVRVLESLPILPAHKLEAALANGTLASAWGVTTRPGEIAGLGPFQLAAYQPGQRIVFERNPHYWRTDAVNGRLPYLDRLTLEIVPDQNTELLRLQAGELDFTSSEVRPEDHNTLRKAEEEGRLKLRDLGVGLDADSLWFNLRPDNADPARPWLQRRELRMAVSHAVDRAAFADTVFLGAGVPVYGPVSPANRTWHWPEIPRHLFDPEHARSLLANLGLRDRTNDGRLEDSAGRPARFAILTQKGNTSLERGAAVIKDSLGAVGLSVDVVALEVGALVQRLEGGDFDAIYFRFLTTDTDPAMALDFWLSAGGAHVWNPGQVAPATDWERQIDSLMARQVAASDTAERQRLFHEAQRILADEVPILYFAAPRVFVATSSRVANAEPALLRPMILWNADSLAVAGPSTGVER